MLDSPEPVRVHLAWGDEVLAHEPYREGTCAVVVDVLRASTTIASALSWGARQVTVVREFDDALAVARSRRHPVIAAGEAGGLPHPEFDTLSSPAEVAPLLQERPDAEVVLRTSNFARVIGDAARCAEWVVAGGVAMASAAAHAVVRHRPRRVLLVPCGTHMLQQLEQPLDTPLRSLEDALGAMCVLEKLAETVALVEAAETREMHRHCAPLLASPATIEAVVLACDYAEYMRRLPDAGGGEPQIHRADISLCARLDEYPVGPVLSRVEGVEHVFTVPT
jgi:phosphosulfolactate phosphohydrolase-like enzyme